MPSFRVDTTELSSGGMSQRRGLSSHASSHDEPEDVKAGTVADRRLLRSHYRRLKSSIAEGKDTLLTSDFNNFSQLVRRADDLYTLVHRPREQVADAEALLDITEAFLKSVKDSRRGNAIKAGDFVSSILQRFRKPTGLDGDGEELMDWTALATEASCVFSDGPGLQTMLGPMDSEPKKRKAMAPRRRDRGPAAQTVRPETVIEEGGDKQSQTDKAIRTMFNVLRRCGEGGCELEQLVLSRDSFAHTVENIFCLSFLVKDGRAQISIQDGKHIVAFKYAPTAAERSGGSHGGDHEQVVNTQFVFRFDFKDWTLMKEAVEPGEELMPKRTQQMSDPQIPTPIRKNSRNRGRVTTSDQHGLMAEMGADDVDECQGQDHENDCAETDRIKRPTKKRIL